MEWTEALLERIDKLEPAVKAWVHLDREGARRTARERAAQAAGGAVVGPLHGVPVALKDIFDVAGMPTRAGAKAFAHRQPDTDATSVARLRAAGAVILGKVTTTTFALMDPSPTGNPWNPAHTPGGSSSGSAAAVGARMAPLALGSQTVGSVLRPAAYCGVVGFKPTHGRISAAGVVPLSWSNDHVGILVRAVEDAALALQILAGPDRADPLTVSHPVDDYLAGLGGGSAPAPRIGVLRALIERAAPENAEHLTEVTRRLSAAGATLGEVVLPASFAGLHDSGQVVVRAEAAAYHAPNFPRLAEEYPPKIREALTVGQGIRAVDFLAARSHLRRFRDEMAPIALRYDALLTPTAPGPAPRGLESTGDPYFCAPWSHAGMPAIALPSGLSRDGLPLSLQLVGSAFAEARLLGAAAWCESLLDFREAPRA